MLCSISQVNNSTSITWHKLIRYPRVNATTMARTNSLVKRFFLISLIPFAMSKQKFFQKLSGYSLVPPSPGDLTQIADSVNDGVQVNKSCLLIVDQEFPNTAYLIFMFEVLVYWLLKKTCFVPVLCNLVHKRK